jgi:alpha-galactosidase
MILAMPAITRRDLMTAVACSGLGLSAAASPARQAGGGRPPGPRATTFLDIVRPPASATVFLGVNQPLPLDRAAGGWEAKGVRVGTEAGRDGLRISLSAPGSRPTHVRLRWNLPVPPALALLGDHWERSYGDLHWSGLVPERVMPWYFLARDADSLHGYGVRTGAAALAFWQVDPAGVSLWLNVCNGGTGVELGDRELAAATVVARRGTPGEDPVAAARGFCAALCDRARPAPPVVCGSNDWYYAYGRGSADQILRDADLMASVAPAKGERPFTIVDDGWQNRKTFPDMAALAAAIRQRNVRPGLWIRPLQAPADAAPALLLPKERFRANRRPAPAYDPTIPEALEAVLAKVTAATAWGYDLVKHDYSTYEIFGQWGSEMKAQPASGDWTFHDRGRTNAEIVRAFYADLRRAAGERTILIGCNTIGHLAAGLFEIQRTGDDTSGTAWERTRRMGVNTLAYRLLQHRTFFVLDADCVPITAATPWACNRQWLDLVARSGTALFVSPEQNAVGDEQRQALRDAFEIVQSAGDHVRPLDWQTATTPGRWEFEDRRTGARVTREYDWYQQAGAWPFDI